MLVKFLPEISGLFKQPKHTLVTALRTFALMRSASLPECTVLGQPFVKRFALCYRPAVMSVIFCPVLSVTLVYLAAHRHI